MTYMLTATGGTFDLWLANPASDISILAIAASLAKINRWGGHTSRLYSVAEHSLHVSHIMEREHAITHPAALMCGLMHDAHEAYTGDLTSPLKRVVNDLGRDCWTRWEAMVQGQVLERFELTQHWREWTDEVHRADLTMLATEARDLMPPHDRLAGDLREIPTSRELVLDAPRYHQATWQQVRDEFLDRFAELRERMQEHVALQADTPAEA